MDIKRNDKERSDYLGKERNRHCLIGPKTVYHLTVRLAPAAATGKAFSSESLNPDPKQFNSH